VTGLVRESAGQATLVASYAYGPFGEKLAADTALGGFIDRNPFRYSTKYTDAETGLVYYGHRYYEPRMGRFLGRDPLGEAGGSNLYGFVGNNPVKTWDYLGMVTPERAREILAMEINQGMHLFLGVGDSITHNHPGRSLEEVSDHDGFDLVMTRTQLEAIASRTDDGNYYPDGSPVKFGDFGEVTVVAPNNTGILRQPGYATSTITGRTHMVGTSPSFPGDPVFAGQVKDAALGFVIGDIMDGITILNPNSSGRDRMIAVGSIILGLGPLPNVGPGLRAGRAAEFPGGVLTETQLINQAESYLGAGYREVSPGRFKSADGTRQFRYGSHETRNPNNHHAHFESLTGEDVTENTVVQIILDPGP